MGNPTNPSSSSPPSPVLDFLVDTANMLKAFIGINFVYVSYAFSKAGLRLAIPSLLIITLLTEHCCILLVRVKNSLQQSSDPSSTDYHQVPSDPTKQPPPAPTYGAIALQVAGPRAETVVNIALVITQLGYCVGYLIFLSTTAHHMLPDHLQATFPVSIFVLLPLPILSTLALLRSIRSLGPFSIIANVALLTGFVSVVFFLIQHFRWAPTNPPISQFPLFFGQMTAALEGIGLVIPVETSMKQRTKFPAVLRVGLVILTTVLMVVGIMGFASFGDDTSSILLTNFGKSPIVTVVKSVLLIGILFTYPLQIVPVFQFIESWLFPDTIVQRSEEDEEADDIDDDNHNDNGHFSIDDEQLLDEEQECHEEETSMFIQDKRKVAVRLLTVGVTAITAMGAGKAFGLVQSLVGSLGASCLAYTAPAYFHYKVYGTEAGWKGRMKDIAIVAFGVIGAIIGTATSIVHLVKGEAGEGV